MGVIVSHYNNQALEMSQEQIANTFSIGTNWTQLRVGILYQLSSSSATSSITSTDFAIGLCSGTASLYGSAAGPTYFAGWRSGVSNTLTYQVGGGTNLPYYTPTQFIGNIGTKVGTAFSSSANPQFGPDFPPILTGSLAVTASWFPLYLDFIKTNNTSSSQLWTITFYRYAADNGVRQPEYATVTRFYDELAHNVPSFAGGIPWQTLTTANVPISESIFGALDSINIFWPKTNPLDIYDIAVYRFI